MPNRDKTGPKGEGANTGRGKGPCGTTEKQLDSDRSKEPTSTTEKQLEMGRGRGGPGKGKGCGGRRKGPNGVTYFV